MRTMLRRCLAAAPPACRARGQGLPGPGARPAWRPRRRGASSAQEAPRGAADGGGSRFLETPFAQRVFSALNLTTFSESELRAVFDAADRNGSGHLEREEVHEVVRSAHLGHVSGAQLERRAEQMTSAVMGQLDRDKDEKISYSEFSAGIKQLAEQRDARIWPVAGSMLVTGLAVGVVIPAMPQLVLELGLTQAEFGYVVSAFGLSKLLANVPAGMIVDSHGRRIAIAGGLAVAGGGMVGVGLSGSLWHLLAARFATGAGASIQMAGATMAITDMSTPLNRARMLAPMLMAFSAGTVFGPAIGGSLLGWLGLAPTFYAVGGLFFLNAVGTRLLLAETMLRPPADASESVWGTVRKTLSQWGPLLQNRGMRVALLVNGAYWVALAGGNMTLLPLMLAGQFGLSPAEIGTTFALQGALSVVAAGPAAALADRWGPAHTLAPALTLMAVSLATLPLAPDMTWAAGPLALMALGTTALSSAPTALAANLVAPESRTQAISLMRTMGDVGWLLGGITVGSAAGLFGTGPAMQATGALLLATAAGTAARGARVAAAAGR